MIRRWWVKFVAFWIGDDPRDPYSRLDELDGLRHKGEKSGPS